MVSQAEIELEQEGKELNWSTDQEMNQVISLIISKCNEHEWEISRSAVTQLFTEIGYSPS